MANPEHVEILKQGVQTWNEWNKYNPATRPDLKGAILRGADLSKADLRGAILEEADLSLADLYKAQLDGADLERANLQEANLASAVLMGADLTNSLFKGATLIDADLKLADLRGTDFSGADMFQTDLTLANFENTNFEGANLRVAKFYSSTMGNANFRSAIFHFTTLSDIDLSTAKNLYSVSHDGPSSIDINTIYRSKGEISVSFLRGCGVPEDFIKLIPSLTSQPFNFYSCFISYSSNDDEFARRLHADLQDNKVRVWFAPEDMKIGDKIRDRIDQTIRIHDKLLLILSKQSIESDWVEKEVETAFEKERRNPGKTALFPIRLDDAVMETDKAWAADIRRTRHIGDFTDWKNHDSYKKNFDRLLRDLNASEK